VSKLKASMYWHGEHNGGGGVSDARAGRLREEKKRVNLCGKEVKANCKRPGKKKGTGNFRKRRKGSPPRFAVI